MTTDVTLTNAVTDAKKTQQQSVKLAGDFSRFLTLLTTQLQNQDPLNPMNSSEFTNQLVQFSQVEQAINTNQKLDNIVGLQMANSLSSTLGYVGLDISYTASEFSHAHDQPESITYALDSAATSATATVTDDKGNFVYQTNVDTTSGKNTFNWDGKTAFGTTAPDGTYSIRIDALDSAGKPINATTVVSGTVKGIETQNGVPYLLVGERAVALANVINATQPPIQQPVEPPA